MIDHTKKLILEKESRHGIPYRYLLNKFFDYFGLVGIRGIPRIAKQKFTLTTLVENEHIERKMGTVSWISELLAA